MKWLLLIPAILVSSCSSPSNNKTLIPQHYYKIFFLST